jgi:hypothetical protein
MSGALVPDDGSHSESLPPEDEGYCTANEYDMELVPEGQSDDEWADWDWDLECAEDHDLTHAAHHVEDERVGLFATGWEGQAEYNTS